jgi:HPt (histidine-containing phosphotransfer) domain-containing protein
VPQFGGPHGGLAANGCSETPHCAGRPFARIDSRTHERDYLASLERELGAETVGKLVEQALAAVEQSAAEIEASLRRGDHEATRRAAHRLAGSAGLAGLITLSSAAATLEDQLAGTLPTDNIDKDAAAALALAERSTDDLRGIYSRLAQNL